MKFPKKSNSFPYLKSALADVFFYDYSIELILINDGYSLTNLLDNYPA